MKTPLFYSLLALALICTISLAQPFVTSLSANVLKSSTWTNDTPYRTEVFQVGSGGVLELQTSGGSLRVTGSNGNEVVVEMFVRRNGRNITPDQSDLRNFNITIEQRGNRVIARAERDSRGTNILTTTNESVSFVVSVPRQFNVDMATSGGNLTLSDITGELKGRTSGGSVTLSDLSGLVDVRTSGGNISLNHVHGDIQTQTSGGSIRAENSTGKLRLITSGGSIRLSDVGGEISAVTSGGSISAQILTLSGALSLRTSGGSITVRIPGNTGMDVDIRGSRVQMPLLNFNGESKSNQVYGTVNGGGHKVELRTSGGSVTVSFD